MCVCSFYYICLYTLWSSKRASQYTKRGGSLTTRRVYFHCIWQREADRRFFFLSYSDFFCLLTEGVEGYCCTRSNARARARTHTHTNLVGFLWTRDRSVPETSTWQHTTFTRDRHPSPQWISNPQSQKASGRRSWTYNVCHFPYLSLNFSLLGASWQL
jgi:hypothetical protein